ncbi:MAG: peptide deformylase [Paludibacteraceae bacterium]|nr:peptide deformylase [Paludibacteraceae bacterium]
MIYPIVIYGNPVLKKVAAEVERDYPELKQLIDDMFKTLQKSEGVGLAAPQIGLSKRLFVIDLNPIAEDKPEFKGYKKVFINPTIVEFSDEEKVYSEGCLSIPGLSEDVRRPSKIKMHYFDENWVEHTEEFSEFPARAIQHEYDHLEGHVYTDRISLIRKQLISKKLAAISKGKFTCSYKYKM